MIDELAAQAPFLFRGWAFVFGAVVGSFLNVVIARVPAGLSIVSPASRCPRCKSGIAWFDNVPILSWVALRARCRSCGEPISARYPTVELLVGLLALAISFRYGFNASSLGYFALAALLVALAYIDLDTWLLPNELTVPLLLLGLASPLWNGGRVGFVESAIGAAAGFAVFAAIALFGEKILHREIMGWGDVVLLGGIGAWLGFRALLPVVMLSALQGSVVGLLLLAGGRKLGGREEEASAGAPLAPSGEATGSGARPAAAGGTGASATATEPAGPQAGGLGAEHELDAGHGLDAEHEHDAEHEDEDDDEDDWTPPPHAVPYGPFLALAALQWLLLGDLLTRLYDDFLRRLWS